MICFEKDDKYYLWLEISVVLKNFFPLNKCFLSPSKQIRWLFKFVLQKSLKTAFKTKFSVLNKHLHLCGHVENSKWLLKTRKIGVMWY